MAESKKIMPELTKEQEKRYREFIVILHREPLDGDEIERLFKSYLASEISRAKAEEREGIIECLAYNVEVNVAERQPETPEESKKRYSVTKERLISLVESIDTPEELSITKEKG